MKASYDALVDLLDSIETFLMRLDIYTQIPHTPTLDEMVVKIMMELLSTLALVTKELKQRRLSKPVLVDVLSHSTECSKICKETLWKAGHRASIAEAGPIDARPVSHGRSRGSQSRLRSRPEYECNHGR